MTADSKDEFIQRVTQALVDQGKLIEAGWISYRMHVLPLDASEIQASETRKAFFAGCQHLFASIMTMLDPDSEPTEADLARMGQVDRELKEYLEDLKRSIRKERHGHQN